MQSRNQRVAVLSFFWMLSIVVLHAGGGSSPLYHELLSDFRVGGVSFFYLVSGYFFAKRFKDEPLLEFWKREFLKRLKTLGIPYLIWCAIGLKSGDILCQFGIISHIPTANAPLWYVKHLLLFCFISPLTIHAIKFVAQSNYFSSVFLLAVIVIPWIPLPLKFGFFLSFLMFSAGVGMAFKFTDTTHKKRVGNRWNIVALSSAWIMFHVIHIMFAAKFMDWPFRVYSATSLLILSWVITDCFENIILPPLFNATFFVYCSHYLLLRYVHPFSAFGTIGYFMNGVLAVILCLLIAELLKRFANPVYKILSGGR